MCPQCTQTDQALRAESVYSAQTGVTDSRSATVGAVIGAGPIIAGTRSHTTHVTDLARKLAPPPDPKRASLLNFGIIALFIIGVVTARIGEYGLRSSNPSSDRELGAVVMAVGVGLIALALLAVFLRRRRSQLRYVAYRRVWPASMQVWKSAIVCLRCYGVFFQPGAIPASLIPEDLVPVESFRAAVNDIGARLAAADPGKYGGV